MSAPSIRSQREGGVATPMLLAIQRAVLTSRTDDAQPGIRAFSEKRKPVWKER